MCICEGNNFFEYLVFCPITYLVAAIFPWISSLSFCRQASLKIDLFAFGDFGSDQRLDVINADLVGGFGKHFNHWFVPSIFADT